MRNLTGAAITLALGVGLAAAAQAQGTYNQSNAPTGSMPGPSATMPDASSGAAMQNAGPATNEQATAPTHIRRHLAARHRTARNEVRQAQQQLKSDGLYRGRIDGRLGPAMRTALRRFQQQNGLRRTGRLDQRTLASLQGGQGSQTMGVGSSAPTRNNPAMAPTSQGSTSGMTPPATPAPTNNNAAGGTNNTNKTGNPTGSKY